MRIADLRGLLTRREWRCLYQVLAIVLFALALLRQDMDSARFIYGQF